MAERTSNYAIMRIVVSYALCSGLWIYVSDILLGRLVHDNEILIDIAVFKAFLFILLTAVLLHRLIRRYVQRLSDSEQSLRMSEAKYRSYIENAPLAVFVIDREGRCLECNPMAVQLLGYPAETLINMGIGGVVAEAEREMLLRNLATLSTAAVVDTECHFLKHNGETILVSLRAARVLNNHVKLICQDISERRRAENALREMKDQLEGRVAARTAELEGVNRVLQEEIAERKRAEQSIALLNRELQQRIVELQLVFDTSPIGLAITYDPQAATIRGNPALEAMIGIPHQGELSKSAPQPAAYRVQRDGRELAVAELPLQRAVRGETVIGETLDIMCDDGTVLNVQSSAAPLLNEEGILCGAVGAFMDITSLKRAEEELRRHRDHLDILVEERTTELVREIEERKQAEALLQQSEQRYRAIVENQTEYVDRYLPGGILTYVNDALAGITGLSPKELLGRSFYPFILDCDREELIRTIESLSREKPCAVTENRIMLPDGIHWHQWNHRALFDDGGNIVEYQSVGRDITERKQAEETVARYTRRLIEVEEELRKDIAMELHDDIGQDLTALGLNLSFISSNMSRESDTDVRSRLEDSRRLTKEINRAVRNIMTNLRPPQMEEYGVVAIVRWYAEQYEKRTGVAVDIGAAPDFPRFSAEREVALFRIVQEALTNVAKHAGATRVNISFQNNGGAVRVCIADNGTGFDPGAPPSAPASAGWGLAIMRERAEVIGARFYLDTAPGTGTTVAVEIREEQ